LQQQPREKLKLPKHLGNRRRADSAGIDAHDVVPG
jgi:hypothetical protein